MVFSLLTLGYVVRVVYSLTGRQIMSGTHSRIGNNAFQNRLLPEQTRPQVRKHYCPYITRGTESVKFSDTFKQINSR